LIKKLIDLYSDKEYFANIFKIGWPYIISLARRASPCGNIPSPSSMSVEYLLSDHLGSTSITTDMGGNKVSEMRYTPWGELRFSWTTTPSTNPSYSLTNHTFTGQYSYMDDPSTNGVTEGFGLMFYNTRMYDPALGRFTSADSIVPGGAQGYDRYAYVNNNPPKYIDPSGHAPTCDDWDGCHEGNPLLECDFDCELGDIEGSTEEQRAEWFHSLILQSVAYSCVDENNGFSTSCSYSFSSKNQPELYNSFMSLLRAINTDSTSSILDFVTSFVNVTKPGSILQWVEGENRGNYYDDLVNFIDDLSETKDRHPDTEILVTAHIELVTNWQSHKKDIYLGWIGLWSTEAGPRKPMNPSGYIEFDYGDAYYFYPE
jgi:RHS repeat-associated protein